MTVETEQQPPNATHARPILISVVQYQPALEAGRMTVADLIAQAQAHGVDGVELRREVWPGYKSEVTDIRRQIEAAGLLVTYATFSTLFNADESAHDQLLEDITTAQALGAPLLRVFPGATPPDEDRIGWARAEAAVAHAAQLGVQIALENFARTPGGTLAEAQQILARITSPALRVNLDIGNYPLHGQDVVEAIHAVGDRAIYVHVKDSSGGANGAPVGLGEGVLPLGDIFDALDALPQRLLLCFEFPGGDDPDGRIRHALAVLRARRGNA
jgi:sugar phosphate isomerase/epimerase